MGCSYYVGEQEVPGTHTPECGGTCLSAGAECGCEGDMSLCSFLLIFLPTLAWGLCIAPSLSWWSLGVGAAILLVDTYYLCKAHCMDPGVLPVTNITPPPRPGGAGTPRGKQPRPKVLVMSGADTVDIKEFRAKMCSETNSCVESFDHFCPWVGNAVGARNYKSFFLFVLFANVLAVWVGITSVYHAFFVVDTAGQAIFLKDGQMVAAVLLIGYCVIILCTVGGLLFYHLGLVSSNTTTNEDIKVYNGAHRAGTNPHNDGCCANWRRFLFTPPRPSHFRERGPDAAASVAVCRGLRDVEQVGEGVRSVVVAVNP